MRPSVLVEVHTNSSPGRPMVIKRFLVLVTLSLATALASGPVRAQSDYCYELAARICDGEELGPCFDSEESWQLLPDECVGDIQSQIEMDREFYEQNAGSSVTTDGDDGVIGSYNAYIDRDDLYNSNGKRLTQVWQVLRQDRANFHKFGISQGGDDWDPFFDDVNNRAAMEMMVRGGYIDPQAERIILEGGAVVHVEILGRNGRGTSVQVNVSR